MKKTAWISVAFWLAASAVHAGPILATYTFTGSPGNQASEPVDLQPLGATFSDVTRGPGVTAFAGANSINSVNWTTSASISTVDYYEWTVTPTAGFEVDLDQLQFSERRSATAIHNFQLRSSLDAFGSALWTVPVPDDILTRRQTFNFGPEFDDITSAVTFRLFGYAAEGGSGTWRLGISAADNPSGHPANLRVSGDASPLAVPEPTTSLLFGMGIAIALARRDRLLNRYREKLSSRRLSEAS